MTKIVDVKFIPAGNFVGCLTTKGELNLYHVGMDEAEVNLSIKNHRKKYKHKKEDIACIPNQIQNLSFHFYLSFSHNLMTVINLIITNWKMRKFRRKSKSWKRKNRNKIKPIN